MSDIGNRLKKARRESGLKQIDIAVALNTTQQQVSKYENGTQEIPVRHIVSLSRLYSVSADYLLCLCDERKPI